MKKNGQLSKDLKLLKEEKNKNTKKKSDTLISNNISNNKYIFLSGRDKINYNNNLENSKKMMQINLIKNIKKKNNELEEDIKKLQNELDNLICQVNEKEKNCNLIINNVINKAILIFQNNK